MAEPIKCELSASGSREAIREQVVSAFLKEKPGSGKGELSSKYEYIVEQLPGGKYVYLKRPAILNYGFDFTVHVHGEVFVNGRRKSSRPSHSNILEDLRAKREASAKKFAHVMGLIDAIYKCEEVTDGELRKQSFVVGYPIETILKSTKWLFIEQDVTYWNWSGRAMLYGALQKI